MINIIKKLVLSPITLILFCFITLNSCSDQEEDDFKKFLEGGEILYTGKIDSLEVYSGKNRMLLEGMLNPDPKVTSFKVSWANGEGSITVPVEPEDIAKPFSYVIDNLEENIYNFEIRTFDNEENSSIPVFITGKVYGDRYKNSLINRPLLKQDLQESDNSALIEFAPVDLTSGILFSELEYTDSNNELKTFTIPLDSETLILENFNAGNTFKYRTAFIPEETAIDTFYTEYQVITPAVPISKPPYFKNATYPFALLEFSGVRYGTPTEWIHNEGALNHNGYGVYDNNSGGGIFNLVSGYGEPKLVNAKVYQKMRLPAGTYTYKVVTQGNNYNGINDQVYLTAALGSTLPDVKDVETATETLVFARVSGPANTYTMEFTLTEDLTDIAIGLAATNGIDPNNPDAEPVNINRYMTFASFALSMQ
ncbi:DUF4998 domain-containing protein [Algibacter pacificus]|uniref:DUF4998 domain-containing protein n=1 Tax=Algibacter pacificus TaxID=2599389 RepID=UPI0011CA34D3|nr:DUF4998 domain-containing protein [Algibacter pacificus]